MFASTGTKDPSDSPDKYVAALAGSALVVRLRAVRALAIVVIAMLLGAVLLFAGFAAANVWMRGMVLTVGLALGYGATVLENFVREQREKQRLSRFFSPDVLRAVVRDRDGKSLQPRRRRGCPLHSGQKKTVWGRSRAYLR